MKKSTTILLASLMMLISSTVIAAHKNTIVTSTNEPVNSPLSVDFIGEDANYLIFRVTVSTNSNQLVSIVVNDKAEGELYAADITSNRVQTYKIEKRENQELNFQLQVGSNSYSSSFSSLMIAKRKK